MENNIQLQHDLWIYGRRKAAFDSNNNIENDSWKLKFIDLLCFFFYLFVLNQYNAPNWEYSKKKLYMKYLVKLQAHHLMTHYIFSLLYYITHI